MRNELALHARNACCYCNAKISSLPSLPYIFQCSNCDHFLEVESTTPGIYDVYAHIPELDVENCPYQRIAKRLYNLILLNELSEKNLKLSRLRLREVATKTGACLTDTEKTELINDHMQVTQILNKTHKKNDIDTSLLVSAYA